MWNFEKIKEEIAGTKDWFSLKIMSWDFLAKSKEDDEDKQIIQIFYKQKFVDELVYFKNNIYNNNWLFIKTTNIFYIFKEIWVLLIPKTVLPNGTISWLSCYDDKMNKFLNIDRVFWEFEYQYWKIYIHELKNNNIKKLWKQFVIDRNGIRETMPVNKTFLKTNIYEELNEIKDINKEWLYSISIKNGKNKEKKYYLWACLLFIKEILNYTKTFFWNEYLITLEKIDKFREAFCYDYSIVVTNRIKIKINWKRELSEQNYIDYQKAILEKFPQLLKGVYKDKNNPDDLSDKYCSFFIRIENDGTVSDLQPIKQFFNSINYELNDGSLTTYPTYPVLSKDSINDDRKGKVYWEYEMNLLIGENNKWNFLYLNKDDIYYSFLKDESSYIRKFFKEKEVMKNKDTYKITFFVWMDILEKRYWKWIYILEIKNRKNIRFLREDWTTIFSIDDFPINEAFWFSYYMYFNEKTWICFFADVYWWKNTNFISLNLLNSKFKLVKNSFFRIPNPYKYNFKYNDFGQFLYNKNSKTYLKQPMNILDFDFKKLKGEYIVWDYRIPWGYIDNIYFKRNGLKWSNFIMILGKEYRMDSQNYYTIKIWKGDVFYWHFNWVWFLNLLYSLGQEFGKLKTNFDNPLIVNDNLKIWFFISST